MPAAAKPPAAKGKGGKVGPFPVWAWGLIIGGGVILGLFLRSRSSGSGSGSGSSSGGIGTQPAQAPDAASASADGSAAMLGGGSSAASDQLTAFLNSLTGTLLQYLQTTHPAPAGTTTPPPPAGAGGCHRNSDCAPGQKCHHNVCVDRRFLGPPDKAPGSGILITPPLPTPGGGGGPITPANPTIPMLAPLFTASSFPSTLH